MAPKRRKENSPHAPQEAWKGVSLVLVEKAPEAARDEFPRSKRARAGPRLTEEAAPAGGYRRMKLGTGDTPATGGCARPAVSALAGLRRGPGFEETAATPKGTGQAGLERGCSVAGPRGSQQQGAAPARKRKPPPPLLLQGCCCNARLGRIIVPPPPALTSAGSGEEERAGERPGLPALCARGGGLAGARGARDSLDRLPSFLRRELVGGDGEPGRPVRGCVALERRLGWKDPVSGRVPRSRWI